MRAHNFSAGPSALPLDVLLELRDELPVYPDLGASLIEVSHRSKAYSEVHERAKERLRRLAGLGSDWHVLFLAGGASMQFYQVPLNLLPPDGSADYLDTGIWSSKAIREAQRVGLVNVAASGAPSYAAIPEPETWQLSPRAAYLHYTSNNTVYGTQFAATPLADVPLVCDASSDFLSRRLDLTRHGLIYAGAQKNLGPAGVTIVLVRQTMLEARNPDLPTMLDYGTHAEGLFNTPPVFAVYLVEKVLAWLEREGGVNEMERRAGRKASLLYGRIDRSDFYTGLADASSRSSMNVTFRTPTPALDARFAEEAAAEGLIGLKGHRTLGGLRASLYNAVTVNDVAVLVSFMDTFEERYG
ncbi:MAG TPA: 3-phosphoserine/phosphohydroxythreonine transaminase [Rhodothermales bacterium]|nr:3-phosphoserine/phosphohydroxythreonine transaminase [Rhodothermales bacterium]